MIDPKILRESPEAAREGIRKKHIDCDLDAALKVDEDRRKLIVEVESLRAEQKAANAEMAKMPKGSPEFLEKVGTMKSLSSRIKEADVSLKELDAAWIEHYLNLHLGYTKGRAA